LSFDCGVEEVNLVALAIAHFVTCNVVANTIARVVAIAIAFVSMG
jgi:hypothetical protein